MQDNRNTREIKFREPIFKWHEFHHWHYWGWLDSETKTFTLPQNYSNSVWKVHKSQQYTGLHDKNDLEIYEGDIIRYDPCLPDWIVKQGSFLWESYWVESGFYVKRLKGQVNGVISWEGEVIGNIYEKPELLGDKDAR